MIRRNRAPGYRLALPRAVVALALAVTVFAASCHAATAAAGAAPSSSPLGLWKTFDDKTGSARAIVRIYEQGGKLFGRIVHSFTPGAEDRVCAVCGDDRKNQPIIGLLIIRNMQADHDEYTGGDILDPESGSVYHCKLHLEKNGSELSVRGYIGFSLLGRTQSWQRQPDAPDT